MNKKKLFMLLAALVLLVTLNVKAEDSLYIYTSNEGKTTLMLDEIRFLTFDEASMTIMKTNGTTSSVDFSNLKFFSLNNYDVTTSMLGSIKAEEVFVYPNPVISEMIVDKLQNESRVVLVDLHGRKLWEKCARMKMITVPMHNYPTGIYFIQISDEKGIRMKKIIKN